MDPVELGGTLTAGEDPDERSVRDHEIVGRDSRPPSGGEPDGEVPAVARERTDGVLRGLAGLVADGRLRNAVTAEVPFDDLPNALQQMADRGVIGKLVMVP